MPHLPVNWCEGMFLRPQHFQAAERYWSERLHTSEHWDHEFNYGLRSVGFHEAAIANFQVQVNRVQARLRDGTLVSIELGQETDRVDLKRAFGAESPQAAAPVVSVFLGLPKLRLGSPNVAQAAASERQRFLAEVHPVQDECQGGKQQDIQVRTLNLRLLLQPGDDLSGYETLKIAQIRRVGATGTTPQIDDDYFPPVLAVDAWPPLGQGIVRTIYDLIGQKIESLSEEVRDRQITFEAHEPGAMERLMMLSQLNQAFAKLRVLAFARGIHPLLAYTELCGVVGQLSVFDPQVRRVQDLPEYDHDDLARIFKHLLEQIRLLMSKLGTWAYEKRMFRGKRPQMIVRLEPKWLQPDWKWYIGVAKGALAEADTDRILQHQVEWKLGATDMVEGYFKRRERGLTLTLETRPPVALPRDGNWMFYSVARGGSAWDNVEQKKTLGLYLNENYIGNLATLEDSEELVLKMQERQYLLKIALFALPPKI